MTTNDQESLKKVLDFLKWANEETEEYLVLNHGYRFYSTGRQEECWSISSNMDGINNVHHETIQELSAVLDVIKKVVVKAMELKDLNNRANCKMITKE